ncbi:hypothetical protein [Chryseobacterium sp. SL1]|uniref:hypothetical protein n=1 Tax=Chryseobacterium sp. SL1 TaxID=2995159 RepID=UPI00227630F9|nr:hypothetical protein [Chryseobacterium sp. SL1]MCY1663477.1 hypothetical protein [Chryseobacterium sp. SL1]
METSNIKQISDLFRQNNNNILYPIIYEYLNNSSIFKYILIDKNKAISIYGIRSEINEMNGYKISGYEQLIENLLNYKDEKVIISNFHYKEKDITIFINHRMNRVLGILSQKTV